ncbi:eukaryotic porin/Tom40 [Mycotypha africana]|uniref:eukaryotic porin/Tom40 n=1 Tax=Mycotypha africana TaxID=64632 RepID=UPI0023009AAC|nr:eukaryotic porin/Tom40 [Mycotypha africana]KAI8973594.1 eukaryotic porin/Tom40 [Mycotypha africana]
MAAKTPEATSATPAAAPRLFNPLSNTFGFEKEQKPSGSLWNPLFWPRWFTYQKGQLNLPNPGRFEKLHAEVTKEVFTPNYLFDGAQANIAKELSPNFHVQHQFSLGSQVMPPMYNFTSGYMTEKTMLQGTMDNDCNLNGVFRQAWSNAAVTKVVAQFTKMAGHSMLQIEQEFNGSDYAINLKSMNPNPLERTGLYMASYLQSVSQHLVLGSEIVLQRPTPDMEETAMSFVGKYTGKDYIATAQFQGLGAIQASYYQRINEKVDFGVELNMMVQGGRREAVATVGGKFDFRQATFRGQIDTTGRVSAVLEEKMAPGFSFLISGDLDHMKGQSKFGVGIMLTA